MSTPRRSPGPRSPAPATPVKLIDRAGAARPVTGGSPLIPLRLIDAPLQRLYVASVAAGLVAVKAYQCWALVGDGLRQSPGLFIQWAVLDTLFLLVVWRLRIPLLAFPWFQYLFLAILAVLLDTQLFLFRHTVITYALQSAGLQVLGTFQRWRAVAYAGLYGRPPSDNPILGRHTVHVLPHSIAKFDLTRSRPCVNTREASTAAVITLPIIVNGTAPATIQFTHQPFTSAVVETYSETVSNRKKKLARVQKGEDWSIYHYHLQVQLPGVYRLLHVRDDMGAEFRLTSQAAVVTECPYARVESAEPADTHGGTLARWLGWSAPSPLERNQCPGDRVAGLQVDVFGVPPLNLVYGRRYLSSETRVTVDDIGTPKPAAPLPDLNTPADVPIPLDQLAPYCAATFAHPLSDVFTEPGDHFLVVLGVTDRFDHQSPIIPPGQSTHLAHVRVHPLPTVQLDATDGVVRRLVAGSPPDQAPTAALAFQGTAPFHLTYSLTAQAAGAVVNPAEEEIKSLTTNRAQAQVRLNTAGSLILHTLRDAHCTVRIAGAHPRVTVETITPPLLTMTAAPIKAACVGEIGSLLTLNLQGEPPFRVTYRQTHVDRRDSRTLQAQVDEGHQTTLRLTPSVVGRYTYEFLAVADRNFPRGVPVRNTRYTQVVHPQPNAIWHSARKQVGSAAVPRHEVCRTDRVTLPVDLSGTGPWTLTYQVVYRPTEADEPPVTTPVTVEHLTGNHYDLTVNTDVPGGSITVDLLSVTDANHCVKDLALPEATVRVRTHRPTVALQCATWIDRHRPISNEASPDIPTVWFHQGDSVNFPIQLEGEPPFVVTYRSRVPTARGSSYSRNVTVRNLHEHSADLAFAEGAHEVELVSVADATCAGEVDPRYSRCQAKIIPPPTVVLAPSVAVDVVAHLDDAARRLAQPGVSAAPAASLLRLRDVANEFWAPPVCPNTPARMDLLLDGHGPWTAEIELFRWGLPAVWTPTTHATPAADPTLHRAHTLRGVLGNMGRAAQSTRADRKVITTAVALSTYDLDTRQPGVYYYRFHRLADTEYTGGVSDPFIARPVGKRKDLIVRQAVLPRPFVRFASAEEASRRMAADAPVTAGRGLALARDETSAGAVAPPLLSTPSIASATLQCVGQPLGLDTAHPMTVHLFGTPPFALEYQVFDPTGARVQIDLDPAAFPADRGVVASAHSGAVRLTGITTHTYHLRPPLIADQPGRYWVVLTAVDDAFGCGPSTLAEASARGGNNGNHAALAALVNGPTTAHLARAIDVRESPDILPLLPPGQTTLCRGSNLRFSLEGTPPWQVRYTYGRRQYQTAVTVRNAQLSIDLNEPGELIIEEVCHVGGGAATGSSSCCRTRRDLRFTVYDLPGALVDGGQDVFEDIYEGQQTQITVKLVGTPPFSFTYVRTALGDPSQTLETHTVTDLHEPMYRIKTSQEGIFQVTAVSDKYCRYP